MRSRLSLADLIRQNVLDLGPEPPRSAYLIPPRLLIMACSARKAEDAGTEVHEEPRKRVVERGCTAWASQAA